MWSLKSCKEKALTWLGYLKKLLIAGVVGFIVGLIINHLFYLQIHNLINNPLLSGALGAIMVAFFSYQLTTANENKKLKREKTEEIIKIIHESGSILSKLLRHYNHTFQSNSEYEKYSVDQLNSDLRELASKIRFCGVLIEAYLGFFEEFNKVEELLFSENGFYKTKEYSTSEIKNEYDKVYRKPGIVDNYAFTAFENSKRIETDNKLAKLLVDVVNSVSKFDEILLSMLKNI